MEIIAWTIFLLPFVSLIACFAFWQMKVTWKQIAKERLKDYMDMKNAWFSAMQEISDLKDKQRKQL